MITNTVSRPWIVALVVLVIVSASVGTEWMFPVSEKTPTPVSSATVLMHTPTPTLIVPPVPSIAPTLTATTPPPSSTPTIPAAPTLTATTPPPSPTSTIPAAPTLTATTPPPSPTPTTPPTLTLTPALPAPTLTPSPSPTPDRGLSLPKAATLVYVQSNRRGHELNVISSTGDFIRSLHPRAAAPAWSPDRTAIAFFGEEGISELGSIYRQGNGIWIIGAEGEGVRQVTAIDHVKNLTWSPDGQKLAFEIDLAPQGGSEIRIIEPDEGGEISRFPGQQPTWSPDSRQLIIKNCAPNCGLWRVNPDGGGGQQITFHSTDSYPSWSPTGQYLVFTSQRDNNWEIYRLSLSNGELRNLTRRLSTDTTPVFSPDGREIYLRTDHPGDWWITAITLEGSNERAVFGGIGPSDDWGLARPAVH